MMRQGYIKSLDVEIKTIDGGIYLHPSNRMVGWYSLDAECRYDWEVIPEALELACSFYAMDKHNVMVALECYFEWLEDIEKEIHGGRKW
jgi:hypothetical protein